MSNTTESPVKMTGWHSLPPEIQWTIWEYVDDLLEEMLPEKAAATAPIFVSRDWRNNFQHYHFHTLVLDQYRLDDFEQLVTRRAYLRENIRTIRLHVKLGRYRCGDCRKPESVQESIENSLVFVHSLQKFMHIMSKWPRPARRQKHHLTLDLGAYSPSDSLHGFRANQLDRGYGVNDSGNPGDVMSHKCPGWLGFCADQPPADGAMKRVQSALSVSDMPVRFATAPAIDELWISRKCYRHISKEILSQLISQGLPSIRHFRHEAWAQPTTDGRREFREGYQEVIKALPRSLDTFSFFYDHMKKERDLYNQTGRAGLGEVLARLAKRMSVCSVSFVVDAEDFLEATIELSKTEEAYPRLEHLTLTSRTLAELWNLHPESVAQLLFLGATMAFQRMPALKSLNIWNGGKIYNKAESFLVRFLVQGDGELHVVWSSTGGWGMKEAIELLKKRWNEGEPSRPLYVYYQRETVNEMTAEGRYIYWHPALRHVLHPESREQTKLEDHEYLLERAAYLWDSYGR